MSDYELPDDCLFTREDEWVRGDESGVTVGITDYAQQQLGDVVFVELPEPGATYAQGESFGVVESVKAVSDLYAPVSGEVIEINGALEDQPEIVNEDCYGDGWFVKMAPSEPPQLKTLLDAEAYLAHIADREDS